jgi:hypothetical protein
MPSCPCVKPEAAAIARASVSAATLPVSNLVAAALTAAVSAAI